MKIIAAGGLRTVLVDSSEALTRDWQDRATDADLIKVRDPDPALWKDLDNSGFTVTPSWVNWVAPLHGSEGEFTGRVSSGERRNIRLGQRYIEENGISLTIQQGVSSAAVEEFLNLNDSQLQRMPRGINYARKQQRQILAERDELLGVFAHYEGQLIAGCLSWIRSEYSLLQLKFSASEPSGRQSRLVRGMYMHAFQAAREIGLTWTSLGNDPALFGHTTQPGLFTFKSRLGFVPIPSRALTRNGMVNEADLYLSLGSLTEPSILLGYRKDATNGPIKISGADDLVELTRTPPLRAVVLSSIKPDADVNRPAGAVASFEHRLVPAGR